MITLPLFDRHRHSYATGVEQGMRITCELLNNRVVSFDPLFMDNILAAAVVRQATEGKGLPRNVDALYDIPLPLRCLWRDDEGRPLWAASCLLPVGSVEIDRDYLHKRHQSGRYTYTKKGTFNIDPQRGRWMDRRFVVKSTVCDTLEAYAIGDPDKVADLLREIFQLGKHRNAGYGHIDRWTVEPMTVTDIDVVVRNGRLIRPIPEAAAEALGITLCDDPGFASWTVPYWHGGSQGTGWREGVLVTNHREEATHV